MVKDWVFHFCRNSLRLPLGSFVRKIHFDGLDKIPKDTPILFAGNHPNSFLDGVVYQHMSGEIISTLTRGDVFLKPFQNYIFRSMRLLPIFRARDADSSIARKGNADTMDELFDRFKNSEKIHIFSEGSSYPEKAVRRLRKGTGHIAIEMAKRSDYSMNLLIIPTAVNYSKFGTLMQTIQVSFDDPIRVLDYKDAIQKDEKQAAEMITNQIQDYLDNSVVTTKGDHTEAKEFLQEMMINEHYQAFVYKSKNTWKSSISKLNKMNPDLADKVILYKQSLIDDKVDDANVGGRSFDAISVFFALFTLGISFPVYVTWWLMWKGIMSFVGTKIKNVIFKDSITVGLGMVFSLFLVVLVGTLLSFFFSKVWTIILLIFAVYGAICWFRLVDLLPYFWNKITWVGLDINKKESLIQKRKEIMRAVS